MSVKNEKDNGQGKKEEWPRQSYGRVLHDSQAHTKNLIILSCVCLLLPAVVSPPSVRAQSLTAEAFGGYSSIVASSNSDLSGWENGWNGGAGLEFKPIPLISVTGHFGYYRMQFGGMEAGGVVVAQSGDPITMIEIAVGARLHLGLFFVSFRTGYYEKTFGQVTTTYVPFGLALPQTTTLKKHSESVLGTNFGLGLRFNLPGGLSISPEARFAFVPRFSSSVGSIGITIGKVLGI